MAWGGYVCEVVRRGLSEIVALEDKKGPIYGTLGAQRCKGRGPQGLRLACLKNRKQKAHVSELSFEGLP